MLIDVILMLPFCIFIVWSFGYAAYTQFDMSVEIDVLANDYLEGDSQGDGIGISEILDAQVDLNNDGVPELMVNNHETKSKDDGIWAYQFPSDWMTGDFNKVALATDFKNKFSMTVPNMAPGFPYAIWPETRTEGKAPAHIVVAGDGDYTAHIMTPTDAKNFEWDLDTIKDEGGTVGALAMSDLDNNGWLELWVPNYDKSYIELWKFSALADYSREDEAQLFLQ